MGMTGLSIWRDFEYGSKFIYLNLLGAKPASLKRLAAILNQCEVKVTPFNCKLYFEAKYNEDTYNGSCSA